VLLPVIASFDIAFSESRFFGIYGNLLLVLVCRASWFKELFLSDMHDALSVLYLGVVQIGLAYTLFTVAMARGVRSLDAGIVGYVEPVS